MTLTIVALQIVICVLLVILLLRRQTGTAPDPRTAQVPDQLARLDVRGETFDAHVRDALARVRNDLATEAGRSREASATDFKALRMEVTGSIGALGAALHSGLAEFRTDNAASAEVLRGSVQRQMDAIDHRFAKFTSESNAQHGNLRESLNVKLNELMASNATQQDRLRASVEDRLEKLNETNAAKLDEMRKTVDEKLDATLHSRLNESFGLVTTHLGAVQKGLGEMKELATGVGDLKKVLSNVSRRGGVGEFLLGQQLEQMFSPEQYLKQVNIKPGTAEKVDYALKFPNGEMGEFVLLPIDAKFPTSGWENLEHAYDHGSADEIAEAGKIFERAIKLQGRSICEKYIDPPTTMPHAIMFLPTEALYAEVVRRPGLQSELQSNCRVTIAGPSTFMAILTSFQMGFHTLAIQKKGDEVWKVLSTAKNEFDKFGGMMDKVRKQVDTVQNTLGEIGGKTKTINRALKNVSNMDTGVPVSNLLGFEEIAGVAPRLAASLADDD